MVCSLTELTILPSQEILENSHSMKETTVREFLAGIIVLVKIIDGLFANSVARRSGALL